MKIKPSCQTLPYLTREYLALSGLMLLGLLFTPLSHADYDEMNTSLKTYSPPEFFRAFLESETKEKGGMPESDFDPDKLLQPLKQAQKVVLQRKEISFLSVDPKLFKLLSNISVDPLRVGQVIDKKIVLKEIEILAALRNPAMAAAKKQVRAELLSYDQIMGLDDTLKQYEGFTKGLDNKAGPVPMKTSIKQSWPFPGLTSLKGKIIREQVSITVEQMNMVQKEVITQVRRTYWNLGLVDKSLKITAETIDALERLRNVATILYKSGKTSFQDVIKINIRTAILKEDLITLASKRKTFEAKLLELLNLPNTFPVGKTATLARQKKIGNPESLYPIARENRQELKVIQHRINKVDYMIQMAESMIQEPFTLGLSANENNLVAGRDSPTGSFAEKTMAAMKNNQPKKPWYGLGEPWLNQTRQSLSSLKQTRIKEEKATDRMVRDAWFLVDKNRRELILYGKKILPLAKSALDVSEREYESGSIPFAQTIDSYTFWLTVNLTIAKKHSRLGSSIAALEQMLGKTL